MRLFTFSILVIAISSCSNQQNKRDIEFEMFLSSSLDRSVSENIELNEKLYEFTRTEDELRIIVKNTLDTLTQLEEYLIAQSGGYQDSFEASRFNLIGHKLNNAPELIRNSPFNIDSNFLNRIPTYLNNLGMTVAPAAIAPEDDPIYSNYEPLKGKDYFDVAFENRNIYQTLVVIQDLKLYYLHLERTFLQGKLEPCNGIPDNQNGF